MSDTQRIVEECTLPSQGKVYDEGSVNPDVILSSMTTQHEMLRLSATEESNRVMAEILDDCIESDLGISTYDLCLGDFQFLMFKLRIVTFGNDYELSTKCPFCGFNQTTTINLDDLEVLEYDESLEDLMKITLPVSGEEVTLALQTPRILDNINKKIREYHRKHKDGKENPQILYTILTSIVDIDGGGVNPALLETKIRNMSMADANAILNRIDLINNKIGVKLFTEEHCRLCTGTYTVPFRVTGEFFRPGSSSASVQI